MNKLIDVMSRVFVFLVVLLFSCSKAPGGRISEVGRFPSPSKSKVLFIQVDAKGIVEFSVKQASSNKNLVSESIGSTYQKWFFYWESDSVLWLNSSDIGMLKIIKFGSDDLVLENKVLKRGDSELVAIPKDVREGISRTLARRLSS